MTNKLLFVFLIFLMIPISNAIDVSPGVVFSTNNDTFEIHHDLIQLTDTILIASTNITVNGVTYAVNSNGHVVLSAQDYSVYHFTIVDSIVENTTFAAVGSGKKFALYGNNYIPYNIPDKWSLNLTSVTTRLWLTDGGVYLGVICPSTTMDAVFFVAVIFFFLVFVSIASMMGESIFGIFGSIGLLCCSWVFAMCSALLGSVFVAIAIGFLLHFIFVRQTPRQLH